jgi:hypothetical protein
MVGDWFLGLVASGAIDTTVPDACLGSLAVGSRHLYQTLAHEGILGFAQPSHLTLPVAGSPLMAINSGIEVDLFGQVNAEWLGERYVGTVGGQTDYFRAARASAGGLAILALASSTARGTSRIVPRCTRITSTCCDVDVIVTEHGVADVRATTLQERSELIAAIAAPRGMALHTIQGRRGPLGWLVRSLNQPMMGSLMASQMRASINTPPAITGGSPAAEV